MEQHRHKARELAFKALYSWELNKKTVFTDILNIEYEYNIENITSDFGVSLFNGVISNITYIDDLIKNKAEHWMIERLEKVDLSILRLSIFSLMFQPEIPYVVTIDEAINISRTFSSDKSYKFINGILDSVINDLGVKN